MDSCLVVDPGEDNKARRSDCLRMVRGSVTSVEVRHHRGVAGAGIDFVEDIDCVAGVGEDSPGRMELAVVEALDHRQVVVSHKGSAVAGDPCSFAGRRSRRLRNNLDSTCFC